MLRMFRVQGTALREDKHEYEHLRQAMANSLWIDAHEPSDEEREELNTFLRAELPESDDVEEIEFSARYFQDQSGIHVHSLFLAPGESGRHSTATVAFILQDRRLITVREEDQADFRLLRMRARAGQVHISSPQDLLVTIFEQKVENLADALEDIHRKLEEVSRMVLEDTDAELEDAIDRLAKLEDSNGKIRLCLMDTQRSISFLQRHLRESFELQETAREIKRDVDTLMSHTAFLFDKINFLMDSTQGFINIEQNQIIKTFSIAAVIFLPPTVVASLYGMNFSFMPELEWRYGYVWAISLMIVSGLAPYWYFKRKDWL
ncbi:magnesium/cobalt transporter CorA [Cellvibrio japonicus]|uniref:Magnesium transport protein CorA n=1 Tax=Cellvibrio japonicus (strain Ueda107) TaxID=498211 RepID=B3PC26_CELJU|nr:magnesium/cobalt transporter CorA [Cellvibrio japonicus]ACE86109.1 magnesium and cobalt transport protein CorA [Cellvibrio japonicus Ueda107]QEI13178.1 magnesium/cobalt transporter CorA [Cellvibrio japonicus]QEI16752.1 magnesium/cobalt transporter CorA [Cellvibrio japonicus]QEI20330.1 magnesium/cobalt transporter CorA [Cellvibrio japonicus]